MTRILIILDTYLPGFKGGGPIRSVENIVDRLGNRFEFWIVTRNHDRGDTTPYPGVRTNAWNNVGKAQVYYLGERSPITAKIYSLIKEVQPDIVYLNSFFSRLTIRVLLLRLLGLLPAGKVVMAPRGELAATQLAQKPGRKRLYLALVRRLGLYRKILWQASSRNDIPDIRRAVGPASRIHIAQNLHPFRKVEESGSSDRQTKRKGYARIVFLSLIRPLKNLDFALDALAKVNGRVDFDIYGPVGDEAYWRTCLDKISALPPNIRASYRGPIEHDRVPQTMAGYHFFLLPTLGETFGHVIAEALAAGCPVIISDTTPWQDLASWPAGWALSLSDTARWTSVLQHCVDMDEEVHRSLRIGSQQCMADWASSATSEQATVELFLKANGAYSTRSDTEVDKVA